MGSSIIKFISHYSVLILAVTALPLNAKGRTDADDSIYQGFVAVPAELSRDAAIMSNDASDALRMYWTPERLKDATPMPLPLKDLLPPAPSLPQESSPSFTVEPTYPIAEKPVEPYTSTNVSPNTQGLRWDAAQTLAARFNGKLWLTDTEGNRAVCSASTVASAGKSLIVTASHCVRNKKGYFTNFLYIPGYTKLKSSATPYGEWAASQIYSANTEGSTSNNDVAFIALKPDENGRKIEEVTGASGLLFNISSSLAEKKSFRFGYPGNHDNGQELTYCYTGGVYEKDYLRHECNMTAGSSGGPSVTDFPHGSYSYGHTFGVNSVRYGGTPVRTGQALFGDVAQRTYQKAGSLLPEIYMENGYIKIKNSFQNNDSIWYIYNPLSGHYLYNVSKQVQISDILNPGDNKNYLKEGDVIYVYAQTTSTQADFTAGAMVKSKLVEVKIK